jgi:PAS domain S-box-containing protein
MDVVGVQGTPCDKDTRAHSVQFYDEDRFLINDLCRTIEAALEAGDTAIVIATPPHRAQVADLLQHRGLNLPLTVEQGRYIALDAEQTLSAFSQDGWPDQARFLTFMGALLNSVSKDDCGRTRRVMAFGEMVAVLFARGQADAAVRLEEFWNELAQTHEFRLHCAYPINIFTKASDTERMARICREHKHVTPSESYMELHSEDERSHAVAVLQQKALALETEIQERENAQKALHEREAELRDFVENAVVPMHWVANDGTILWANRAELNLLGYRPEEYIGHRIAEFHVSQEGINDILRRLAGREELQGYRAQVRCRDGSTRFVRIYSNVLCREDRFVHTRCFTIDVTDRERSERRMAAQLAITRLLTNSDSLVDLATDILEIICGISDCEVSSVWQVQEEANDLRCIEVWHDAASSFPRFQSLTKASSLKKGEGLPGRIWESGESSWISDIRDENNFPRKAVALEEGLRSAFAFPIAVKGRVWGVVEFFSRRVRQPDEEFMTMMAGVGIQMGQFAERKQVDDARNKLAAIVECSEDAIISKDLNGVVTSWNKGAERIFGYKQEEMVGLPITLIIPPELQDDEPKILAKIREGHRIEHFETERVAKNGHRVKVSLTVSPVRDDHGDIIGAAKIARDITAQRQLEAALHTAEQLASVGRLAATVAHEINNPLESVTNLVYLAKTSPSLPDNIRCYLNGADQELSRVAHIARQTLGFYRGNSRPVLLNVAKMIADVTTIYERKLENKNIQLVKRIDPGLEITAPEGELKQVLSNLIANAIDASLKEGKIWLAARAVTDSAGCRGVRLLVGDNGVGIPPEQRHKLFAPFFTTKQNVGTGLGLWITKELVEKSGGHIRVRSRIGKPSGTVMAIFVPSNCDSASPS